MNRQVDNPGSAGIPDSAGLVDSFLEAGWLLVAILVPLGINLWARQPFEPAKAALLRTFVWGMFGLWLLDCLLKLRKPWHEWKNNPLFWPTLAFAAAQILSTAAAEDWRLSLWGNYERSQGLLTLLSYALLFLLVSARLRRLDQAQRLVGAMVATAIPLFGLGLAQALGWDPIGLLSDARSPIYATLGRSNFMGAYLAMLLPLTLMMTLISRQWWQRLAGLGLIIGELGMLALTLARGAWLAAGVAMAVLGLLWLWPSLAPRWRKLVVGGGPAFLACGLVGIFWLGSEGGSTAARLTIWRASLELIVRRPLLGYGPDALGLVFPRVYPPQLVYYQGRGLAVDRAHNLLLDWTVTTGVLGLLAFLVLLASLSRFGWRSIQRAVDPERRALIAACLAAVVGNVAGNLVSFDVTATAAATWLLMAVLVAMGREEKRGTSYHPPSPQKERGRIGLALPMLLVVGIAVFNFNVRPQAADVMARTSDRRGTAGEQQGAIKAMERTVALWPDEPTYHSSLSWAYLQQALTDSVDPLPWLNKAEAELLAACDLRPSDFNTWVALGELYSLWGNRWDAAKLSAADDAYRQATELAPHHATLYAMWGMVDLEGGRFEQAAAKFRRAVELDATDGYTFTHLGDAELAQGNVTEALAAYQQAVHWEPGLAYAHLGLARCYWQLGHRQAAELALEKALRLDPDNPVAQSLRQQMSTGP
jgi:O-antigen ligase/Tfp pilus assembly protein PilF